MKQAGSSAAPASADQTQEVGRLRGEMEKKTMFFDEELARKEAQHSAELKALRKELRDAESQQLNLQKEIMMLKDKLEKTRRERYRTSFPFLGTVLLALVHFSRKHFRFLFNTLSSHVILLSSLSVMIPWGNYSYC